MKRRRVKITGIGPVTPAGIGREEFWRGILSGQSFIRPYTKLGVECGQFIAASIDKFSISKWVDRTILPKGIGRHTQFAVVGAKLALADAGISPADINGGDCVVVSGSSLMDFGGISSSTQAVFAKGPSAALPRTIFTTTNANVTESIIVSLGVVCRTMTLQNSCCSGLDAIAYAASMISRGEAELAICGGTEAPLHKCPLLELRAAGLTPPTAEWSERFARPFDLWRTTGVVSEGCCMFVLEPYDSPRKGYCCVEGYGFCNDSGAGVCDGIGDAVRMALADARLRARDIEVVNAWGPGHRQIDAGECLAMREVFGDGLNSIAAYSIKGAVGSALGAAPAIQIAASALGICESTIPSTVNWRRSDPSCPLSISHRVRYVEHSASIVNSHGVGGVNSSIVISRC